MYYYKGTHYLYYLCGPYTREVNLFSRATYDDMLYRNQYPLWILGRYQADAVGEYAGMATSKDGVIWKEYGTILKKSEKNTSWMGTGSIWPSENYKKDGKFIMNYSEWRPEQTIFFAESTDLIKWNKLGDDYAFRIDDRWYSKDPTWYPIVSGRWDCIASVSRKEGGRYGYWTADLKPSLGKFGFGFGYTEDGIRWEAQAPPKIDWESHEYSKPKFSMEIVGMAKIGDYYYGIAHIGEFANCTFMSKEPQGPFWPAKKNYYTLAGSATNCVRFHETPEGPLIHYTAWDQHYKVCYFSPLKQALIDSEGILRLGWWDGNNKLKDKEIKVTAKKETVNGLKITMLDNKFDTDSGIILEGTMDLAGCDVFKNDKADILSDKGKDILEKESSDLLTRNRLSGIYVEYDKEIGTAFLIDSKGVTKYGSVKSDGSCFSCHGHINREYNFSSPARFRLLLKEALMEFYLNDIMIQAHTMVRPATGKLGIIINGNNEILKDLKAWKSI